LIVDTLLPAPVSQLVQASADEDMAAFLDAWAPDALLSDSHRKYWGREAIRRWASIEWLGDHVRVTEVRDLRARGEDIEAHAVLDGIYDKQELPADYLCTFLFKIRDDRIARLIILPVGGRRLGKMTPTRMASTCFSAPMPAFSPPGGGPAGAESGLSAEAALLLAAVRDRDAVSLGRLFTDDALVNDKHRTISGRDAIQRWAAAEVTGPGLQVDVTGVAGHYGDCVITASFGGGFDRALFDAFTVNSSMSTLQPRRPDALHALYVTSAAGLIRQLIVTPVDGSSPIVTDPEPLFVSAPLSLPGAARARPIPDRPSARGVFHATLSDKAVSDQVARLRRGGRRLHDHGLL
jgi:ketosteroid isomerase-like protein